MANGNSNGNASKQLVATLVGTGILGVISAGMLSVANDARVAINVAEQHGQEILILRGEIVALRQELATRTSDRFTSKDHTQYDRYITERLDRIENGCRVK